MLQSVLSAYTVSRLTTLRVNTLKATVQHLTQIFDEHKITYERSSVSPLAFIVRSDKRTILDLDAYKNGLFYIQSLSSMLPVITLDPKPDETILDIAAAPGSKTTQMAALMQNKGHIVANDNSRIRGYKLQANLKTQGVTNTTVVISPGQTLWQNYPEYFDKSLCRCTVQHGRNIYRVKSQNVRTLVTKSC